MISQTYAFKQNPDTDFRADRMDGTMAVPMRCHRAMAQASLVVSPPLSVLGAAVMALLALPREIMMAGAVMAPRLKARRHRSV